MNEYTQQERTLIALKVGELMEKTIKKQKKINMNKQITSNFLQIFKKTLQEMNNPDSLSSYEINEKLKEKGVNDYFFKTGSTAVAFRKLGYVNDGYRSKRWIKKGGKSINQIENLNNHFASLDLSFLNKDQKKPIHKQEEKNVKKQFSLNLFWGLIKIQRN